MTTTTRAELAFVEKPSGPPTPPPVPTPGQKVDAVGAITVLTGALTGLALTAQNAPELVFYPIGASLAATVIGAIVLLRTPPRHPA